MKWGVCCTAKAPLAQLLAFVAWHKHLGAAQIWMHLDDADAVSGAVLNQIDGVTAVLCDAAYWAKRPKGRPRPTGQEGRQAFNLQRIYAQIDLPYLAHLDVDEFLLPARSVSDILDDLPADAPFIRMPPAEALYDPSLKDDIFTARQFRLPFPTSFSRARKAETLGEYYAILPHNMLSHRVGKSLFRRGVAGMIPRIHTGIFPKAAPPIKRPPSAEMTVLHFHAQDPAAWRDALPHRIEKGAYRFNAPLAAFLGEATATEIDAFYHATQTAHPALVTALASEGLLIEADLQLRKKVARLL